MVEGDGDKLTQRIAELSEHKQKLSTQWQRLQDQRDDAQRALRRAQRPASAPPPPDVQRFRRVLDDAGIAHHLIADIDPDQPMRSGAPPPRACCAAVAGSWCSPEPGHEAQAMALAEERFRHYIVADAEEAPAKPDPDSLLAVLKFSAPAPRWLLRQLASIRRVPSTPRPASRLSGDGSRPRPTAVTTAEAARSGRPRPAPVRCSGDHPAAAGPSKLTEQLDEEIDQPRTRPSLLRPPTARCTQISRGAPAAAELLQHAATFEEARRHAARPQDRPAPKPGSAGSALRHSSSTPSSPRPTPSTPTTRRKTSCATWRGARPSLTANGCNASTTCRARPRCRASCANSSRPAGAHRPIWPACIDHYDNAKQATLRAEAVERELNEGSWETDAPWSSN